jgi:hypothetical protein
MPKIQTIPTEDQEQLRVVAYLEALKLQGKVLMFTAHADNMKTNIVTAVKAKRMGKRSGYPDLTIVTKKTVLYIELKRVKGGVVSEAQKEWIEAFKSSGSVKAWVCKGFEEAKYAIDLYI